MPERPSRDHVAVEQTWNLAAIVETPAQWAAEAARLTSDLQGLSAFQGRLTEGATTVLACLRALDTLLTRLDQVHKYAYFSLAADSLAPATQAMAQQANALVARAQTARSFIETDLAALPPDTIEGYLAQEPDLSAYRALLWEALSQRRHLLVPEAETALAALSEVLQLPSTIWGVATAMDMDCPPAHDEHGQEHAVSIAAYVFGHASAADQTLRRTAYRSLTAGLRQVRGTLATTLSAHIQQNVTVARLRGFNSATEMILAAQQVPVEVYHTVLDVVHAEIAPHARRLARLRAAMLGVQTLERHDLEAPLEADTAPETTVAEAARLIQEALRPLGEEYGALVTAAFRDRWIDWADNLGKRSGAFCWPVAGVHPYVFTTWRGTLRNVFTLAHELGHAGHYTATLRHQPLSTFKIAPLSLVLEAPSTANELLLAEHLLQTTTDPQLRCWIIAQSLGTFTHNMVTHLLEGHFERRLYELAEAGTPLTLSTIMEVQGEVFERFYAGTVTVDEGARLYWAQQPHFYMNHYSYTYAAGVASGYAAVRAMQEEGQPAVDRWLHMLTIGNSLSPLDTLRQAGADSSDPHILRQAARRFGALVDELASLYQT